VMDAVARPHLRPGIFCGFVPVATVGAFPTVDLSPASQKGMAPAIFL
jgi:hypothetical protein